MRWSWLLGLWIALGCNSSAPPAPDPILEQGNTPGNHEGGPSNDPYTGLQGSGDGHRPPPTVDDAGPAADPYH